MQSRVEALGGSIAWSPGSDGRGARLTALLPLRLGGAAA
jgi:signal transduction histidine kinase